MFHCIITLDDYNFIEAKKFRCSSVGGGHICSRESNDARRRGWTQKIALFSLHHLA